jgi:hypothetical protein
LQRRWGVIEKGTDDEMQCPTCGGSAFELDDSDDKNNEAESQCDGMSAGGES